MECFGERQLAEFQWDFGLNKELRPTRDKISCVPDLILRHVHVLFCWVNEKSANAGVGELKTIRHIFHSHG